MKSTAFAKSKFAFLRSLLANELFNVKYRSVFSLCLICNTQALHILRCIGNTVKDCAGYYTIRFFLCFSQGIRPYHTIEPDADFPYDALSP